MLRFRLSYVHIYYEYVLLNIILEQLFLSNPSGKKKQICMGKKREIKQNWKITTKKATFIVKLVRLSLIYW